MSKILVGFPTFDEAARTIKAVGYVNVSKTDNSTEVPIHTADLMEVTGGMFSMELDVNGAYVLSATSSIGKLSITDDTDTVHTSEPWILVPTANDCGNEFIGGRPHPPTKRV